MRALERREGLRQDEEPAPRAVPAAPARAELPVLPLGLGNRAIGRWLAAQSVRGPRGRVLARLVAGGPIDSLSLRAVPGGATYSLAIVRVADVTDALQLAIDAYNAVDPNADGRQELSAVIESLREITGDLEWLIPSLGKDIKDQSADDKASYTALVNFQSRVTRLSQSANDEVARVVGVQRAGPGGRPDANNPEAIMASIDALGLSKEQKAFLKQFVAEQGGGWKEAREALTGIWAKAQGQFTDIKPGKDNKQHADVEYRTTDKGKPELWDQKTIYSDQTPFDGRLEHTHTKATDSGGKGVGLLFDSTYEGRTNYEKAWLGISQLLISGTIPPEAVKEVHAPAPDQLRAGIFVDMTKQDDRKTEEGLNVRWAEKGLAGRQDAGLEVIAPATLKGMGLPEILSGATKPFSRYSNNRNWLPDGVYNEFPVKGLPNPGKARFVVSEEAQPRIYLSVTHYKGFTVLKGTVTSNRNPFYRVV